MSGIQLGSMTSAFSTPTAGAASASRPQPDLRGFGSTPSRKVMGTPSALRPPPTPARPGSNFRNIPVERLIFSSAKKPTRVSPRAVSPVDGSASVTRKRQKDERYGGSGGGSELRLGLGASSSSSALSALVPPTSPLRDTISQAYVSEGEDFALDEDAFDEEDLVNTALPDIPKYTPVHNLGSGHFSTVIAAKCDEFPHELFAIKKMDKSAGVMSYERLKLWDSLSHPNVVRFYRAWQSGESTFILMQYCEGGTLFDYVESHVKEGRRVSHEHLLAAFRDCTSGLQHMHAKGVVHMDFKSSNVCLRGGRAVLCDFNLICKEAVGIDEPTDKTYQAMEVMKQAWGYLANPAADIFSLGISFLELMLHEHLPTEGESWHILRTHPLQVSLPRAVPNEANEPDMFFTLKQDYGELLELVSECMNYVPEQRPSAYHLHHRAVDALHHLLGESAKYIQLVPLAEDIHAVVHSNRPESAGLYVGSPRESVTPRVSSTGAGGPSPFLPVGRSPVVSRSASRNASPFPASSLTWAGVAAGSIMTGLGGFDEHMSSSSTTNVDVLSVRMAQAAVTPRSNTPHMFAQSSRASSPRPLTSSPTPLLPPGGLLHPMPSTLGMQTSPQRPRSLAPSATL